MRYYSDELQKVFDTEAELLAEEESARQVLETKKQTKAKLAKAVKDASNELDEAYDALEQAEAQVKELQKEYDAKVDEIMNPAKQKIEECAMKRSQAIKEFNDKFGVYTTSYKGNEAIDEFIRMRNRMNNIFNFLF